MENILSVETIVKELYLEKMQRKWSVKECVATHGIGLREGFEWAYNEMKNA